MSVQLIKASAHATGLPDQSVHCVVTSPPYYGLRAYAGEQMIEWPTVRYSPMPGLPEITIQGCEPGCAHEWATHFTKEKSGGTNSAKVNVKGKDNFQIVPAIAQDVCIHCDGWRGGLGNEPNPESFIGHLILVMREMWRVLRDDGVCFVNLGDSYNGSGGAGGDYGPGGIKEGQPKYPGRKINTLKPKDLCMIPARFALAAQADGWTLRSDIIWHKPNPMPESVTDRPTKAHEFIYLLTKSEKYFYDAESVKEAGTLSTIERDKYKRTGNNKENRDGFINHLDPNSGEYRNCNGQRNRRSVWTVATAPYPGSHFATFPPALVEPMIKAGSSAYGVCPQCKSPWMRVVEKGEPIQQHWAPGTQEKVVIAQGKHGITSVLNTGYTRESITTGWQPTCTCGCADVEPATVLDPFSGSGTTGRVALQLNRSYIGIDICDEYLTDLSPARLSNVQIEMALGGGL